MTELATLNQLYLISQFATCRNLDFLGEKEISKENAGLLIQYFLGFTEKPKFYNLYINN